MKVLSFLNSPRADSVSNSNGASFNKTNALARMAALYFGAISALKGVKDVKDMIAHRKEINDGSGNVTPAYTVKQQAQKGAIAAAKIGAGALVAFKAVK